MRIKHTIHSSSGLGLSLDDLRGKQSVRATFKLPSQVIDLLSVVAGQLGIKQKSLFDQLVEDVHVLQQVAEEAQHSAQPQENRRQKTFVISRNSLISLEVIAEKQRVHRDLLVEASIKRLLPVIANERKKHEKRKVLLKEVIQNLEQNRALLKKTAKLLGTDDQMYHLVQNQVNLAERNAVALQCLIEKGKPLENWSVE